MSILDGTVDEEAMVRSALADVDRRVGTGLHDEVEAAVRRHVHAWYVIARIKTFVAIIAGRHTLEELRSPDGAA